MWICRLLHSSLVVIVCVACACVNVTAQSASGNVRIEFHHMVGEQQLEFDSRYQNSLGEPFTVRKFRYYISNIEFSDTTSDKYYRLKDQYFLINEADPHSKTMILKIPNGIYNRISFLIGVDSLKNVSGAQSGALDPLNDMFWTWKSGYVMAKLEGQSGVSTLPHKIFEYHIGGFTGTHNVLGRVTLSLPFAVEAHAQKKAAVHIAADINRWFDGMHQLSIAQHPACTSIGALAKQFSENYLQMFTIQSVTAR